MKRSESSEDIGKRVMCLVDLSTGYYYNMEKDNIKLHKCDYNELYS